MTHLRRPRILSYGCSTAAGPSARDFWNGLRGGVDHSRSTPGYSSKVCAWRDSEAGTSLEFLLHHSLEAWRDSQSRAPIPPGRIGVILASTKGMIDDWVWGENPDLSRDSLTPLLEAFISATSLDAVESVCLSNACASSLCALQLAESWLRQERADLVIILAADRAGPFVRKGFETLKITTATVSRPFGRGRDGLYLGDAAAVLVLGRAEGGFAGIEGVATETEGFAVTRPNDSGSSLKRACLGLPELGKNPPSLIIAHGTGTLVNDRTEDRVFSELFGDREIPVTGTKWSIGHTLGASGALDLIAACEALQNRALFGLATTVERDPELRSRYVLGSEALRTAFTPRRILVTSLGFGGVHAAAMVGP